jgi:branched-chain amino acid transport system substrate-binding protein
MRKAGPAAINDVGAFMKAMDDFSMPNPYLKEPRPLRYVGKGDFGQKRQISIPMVVTEYRGGEFRTLFVGEVGD